MPVSTGQASRVITLLLANQVRQARTSGGTPMAGRRELSREESVEHC